MKALAGTLQHVRGFGFSLIVHPEIAVIFVFWRWDFYWEIWGSKR